MQMAINFKELVAVTTMQSGHTTYINTAKLFLKTIDR